MKLVVILCMILPIGGCSKSERVQVTRAGISLELPEGWHQGERGADRYEDAEGGQVFFLAPRRSYPIGVVHVWPSQGKSVKEFVEYQIAETRKAEQSQAALAKQLAGIAGQKGIEVRQTQILSKMGRKVGDVDAVELAAENREGIKMLRLYVAQGDKIVEVTFQSRKEEYDQFKSAFQSSLDSVKLKT